MSELWLAAAADLCTYLFPSWAAAGGLQLSDRGPTEIPREVRVMGAEPSVLQAWGLKKQRKDFQLILVVLILRILNASSASGLVYAMWHTYCSQFLTKIVLQNKSLYFLKQLQNTFLQLLPSITYMILYFIAKTTCTLFLFCYYLLLFKPLMLASLIGYKKPYKRLVGTLKYYKTTLKNYQEAVRKRKSTEQKWQCRSVPSEAMLGVGEVGVA